MPTLVVTPAPAYPTVPTRPVARTSAPPAPMEIAKEFLDKVANAPDYSWVTGQLFYVHAEGGLWVVRYAPVDREDRYGGSVVLAAAVDMNGFQEGDLVTVHGEILNPGRASKYLGGPLYRTLGISLNERRHEKAE
jgi:hypothetical protein